MFFSGKGLFSWIAIGQILHFWTATGNYSLLIGLPSVSGPGATWRNFVEFVVASGKGRDAFSYQQRSTKSWFVFGFCSGSSLSEQIDEMILVS